MNSRTTWTLLLLAAGVFAFIFFFERQLGPADALMKPGRVLPDLKPADVTAVVVWPAGQPEIRVVLTNQSWQLLQPIHYPAQAATVENLLQALARLTWRTHITALELKDRPQAAREFGLDAPSLTLFVQEGDRRTQIQFGSPTALRDEFFLQVVGVAGIYVVDADLLKLMPRTANDWRDPALVSLKKLAFDRLIVTNGGKVLELQHDATNQLWRMLRPLEARADSPKIESMLQKLQAVRVTRFVTDDLKADLESFGLQPPEWELAFAEGDNPVLAFRFSKSPTNEPGQIYVRRADQAAISLVPSEALATWCEPFDNFRDRHLVTLAANPVNEIEVRGPENFVLQLQSNNVWRVIRPENLPADTALVHEFIAALAGLEVAQFVKTVVTDPDLPSYGLAPAARQYIMKTGVDGTNAVFVRLDFGATTNGNIFVRRSDETAVYSVKLADLQNLPAAGWQLRDRRLWNFTEDNVTRLVIRQNGKARELIHQGTNRWAFAPGSQGIINNFAVEEAVHGLGGLTAAAWTDRGEQNRSRLGFSATAQRISLDVKSADKLETFSLELGGTAPSQLTCAAVLLDGQTWFFELPARTTEMIRSYLSIATGEP
jgi:hypothetical protein